MASAYKIEPEPKGTEQGKMESKAEADPVPKFFSKPKRNLVALVIYHFDSHIGKIKTQVVALLSGLLLFVIVYGLIYYAVNKSVIEARWLRESGEDKIDKWSEYTMSDGIWDAWTFMADGGNQAPVQEASERWLAFVISWTGLLFFSAVLGLIVDAYQAKMEQLKKGRGQVVETDHTLMCGWSNKSIGIIKEIALANESEGGGVVVVLTPHSKEEIDFQVSQQIEKSELYGTKVVVRSGNPIFTADLSRCAATVAKSILICSTSDMDGSGEGGGEEGGADKADAITLRVVLALKGLGNGLNGHIVAEIRDVDNANLIKMVGSPLIETVVSHDITGRLMLMSARQPGLAKVYSSILGFQGDEFYVKNWPELAGVPFGEVSRRFPLAIPIGLKSETGKIILKPPNNYLLQATDEVIVIAEDDDTYKVEPMADVNNKAPPPKEPQTKDLERVLICGWRRDIRDILMLLDSFCPDGSEIHLLNMVPPSERDFLFKEQGLNIHDLQHVILVHHLGNSAIRKDLAAMPIDTYTSAMILADESRENDMLHSDSHTLASLLLLRDQQSKTKKLNQSFMLNSQNMADKGDKWQKARSSKCSTICEILDQRTEKTIASNATVSRKSDFVQSNAMISQILAMVTEDRGTMAILDELLGPDGCGFAVKPCSSLCGKEECTFYELALRAQMRDEDIAVGYQLQGPDGIPVVNPRDKTKRQSWEGYDLIVVTGNSRASAEKNNADAVRSARVKSLSYADLKRIEEDEVSGVVRLDQKRSTDILKEFADEMKDMESQQIVGMMLCLQGAHFSLKGALEVKGVLEGAKKGDDKEEDPNQHPAVKVMSKLVDLVAKMQSEIRLGHH